MKNMSAWLGIIAVSVTTAMAGDSTNSGWTPSVSLKSGVASQYLASGSGGLLYNKPAVQTDLSISFENGFNVDLWNATPFERYDKNFGTEQDLGLGWSGPLSTFGLGGQFGKVVLDIGSTFFDEPKLATIGAGDILYSYVKLSKEYRWFTVRAVFENYTCMPHSAVHGGNLYSVGGSKSWSFFRHKLLTASTSLLVTYDDGGFAMDNGFLLHGTAGLDWRLSKHLTMTLPQFTYYAPITVRDSRTLDKVIYAGFGWRF